ncbi:glycosyltransferase family 4 protein [Nostoc sp. CHAB 5844]|nr:glycosyltransferase family 4 protein [Nostoc sp. CHAB 5844]
MNIVYVTPVFFPSKGGIETLVQELSSSWSRLGHNVLVVTYSKNEQNKDDLNIEKYEYSVKRVKTYLSVLRDFYNSDIVLVANMSLKNIFFFLIFRKKVVFQHNNAYEMDDGNVSIRDRLKRFFVKRFKGICVSQYVADQLNLSVVIKNPVRIFINDSSYEYEGNRLNDLIFAGRFVSQKGVRLFCEAMYILDFIYNTRPSVIMVGDGPDFNWCEQFLSDHSLLNINLIRWVQSSKLSELMRSSKFIVVPSTYREPFGMVALEGLASGCVPIVSNLGGLLEAVDYHCTVFDPKTGPEGLAYRIKIDLENYLPLKLALNQTRDFVLNQRCELVAERYLEYFYRSLK